MLPLLALLNLGESEHPLWLIGVPPFLVSLLTLAVAGVLIALTYFSSPGKGAMVDISVQIQQGARAFLFAEFRILGIVVILLAFILGVFRLSWQVPIFYVLGAGLSALAGWIGMSIATLANVRTCHAAKTSLTRALRVSFWGGAVMGLSVVGFGLLGMSLLLLVFGESALVQLLDTDGSESGQYIAAFGFGASTVALFARVGGGIYTKAADVGADLVGKVESGIPEDDPHNPATIADNVGDNVGDVAGMGADLFESYCGSVIAAATLAAVGGPQQYGFMALPFYLASAGTIASVIGVFLVYAPPNASQRRLLAALDIGLYSASAIFVGFTAVIVFSVVDLPGRPWPWFVVVVLGLLCGILIGKTTEYYTSYEYCPTKDIARASVTGPATVVIQGLSTGLGSVMLPALFLSFTIWFCALLAERAAEDAGSVQVPGSAYAVALAAVGMLSTLGVSLATDAFGPIADNAGGIAEMAGLPEEVRERTDNLDALGNTTAAIGKGFALGSSVLTALGLAVAYSDSASKRGMLYAAGLAQPYLVGDTTILPGMLIGAAVPFLFSALTMVAVARAAGSMILNVREQFRANPELLVPGSDARPDSKQCIMIATNASLQYMAQPGILTIIMPLFVGYLIGVNALLGYLFGSALTSFLLGYMLSAAGGAWDNAKKYIEAGHDAQLGGKGSEHHKAVVVGDTVGDPAKDTSGPALNVSSKLSSLLALVLAPTIGEADVHGFWWIGIGIGLAGIFLYVGAGLWISYTQVSLGDLLASSPATDDGFRRAERLLSDDPSSGEGDDVVLRNVNLHGAEPGAVSMDDV